jgi:hypothetical protein
LLPLFLLVVADHRPRRSIDAQLEDVGPRVVAGRVGTKLSGKTTSFAPFTAASAMSAHALSNARVAIEEHRRRLHGSNSRHEQPILSSNIDASGGVHYTR